MSAVERQPATKKPSPRPSSLRGDVSPTLDTIQDPFQRTSSRPSPWRADQLSQSGCRRDLNASCVWGPRRIWFRASWVATNFSRSCSKRNRSPEDLPPALGERLFCLFLEAPVRLHRHRSAASAAASAHVIGDMVYREQPNEVALLRRADSRECKHKAKAARQGVRPRTLFDSKPHRTPSGHKLQLEARTCSARSRM